MTNPKSPLTYADAGVNIDAGNQLVERIKSVARATQRPEVLTGLGGFGALFELPKGYREPVLVSGTDGVGTKLRLAMELNQHRSVGIDLVAMCVNDLIVGGAEPLYFLDYYATGKLNVENAATVVEGIGEGCKQAGCALVGGETAEMPGMYSGDDYDLAGFCVGIVEKSQILDGSKVKVGDTLIALKSNGAHSNGYSLIRKIIEINQVDLSQKFADTTLGEALLEPTKIYVKPILSLLKTHAVHALAHITGGGLTENIPRVLPQNTKAVIDTSSWDFPEIFNWLQETGGIERTEMYRTFNCGIGMIVCVPKDSAGAALEQLNTLGEEAFVVGNIDSAEDTNPFVDYR